MAEQEENKPKWLVELESRKRKPHLGHETGAGAPCLTCESACPGLDLHFWRKICKICKCRGDEHDFDDEDFPQFELIFGPSVKNKKNRSVFLPINNKKTQSQNTFEWIPPNTTKELAADYMSALPSEKLPIIGSPGAALRKQQLKKQLPLHDIDHKACDKLSEEEKQEFDKYLDNLKNCAGQGKVFKLTAIKPFSQSLMTPANASDVQTFSSQHSQENQLGSNTRLNLRTPGSFIPKSLQTLAKSHLAGDNASLEYREDLVKTQTLLASQEKNPHHNARYHHVLKNIPNDSSVAEESNVKGNHHLGSELYNKSYDSSQKKPTFGEIINSKNVNSIANEENVPGNVINNSMKPELNKLESRVENIKRQFDKNLEFSQDVSENSNKLQAHLLCKSQSNVTNNLNKVSSYSNPIPSKLQYSTNSSLLACSQDLQTDQIKYKSYNPIVSQNSQLKQNYDSSKERSTPYGINYIKNPSSVVNSAPNHTNSVHQTSNSLPHKSQMEKIAWPIEQSLEFSSDLPPHLMLDPSLSKFSINCMNTNNTSDILPMNSHDSNFGNTENIKKSDEPCFNVADKKLKNSSVVSDDNYQRPSQLPYSACIQADLNTSLPVKSNIIYSEQLNNPVFADDSCGASVAYQNSENISHLQEEMEGMTMNVTKEHKCHKCEEDIHCGDVVVSAEKIENAVWHPGCFVCSACDELLVDLVYFTHKGKLYCGRDLAELLKIPRCFACDELIFVREYTVAEGHNYHVKHFCCWDCDIPLADQQYVTENDRPLCLPCYKKNYAKTCRTCDDVIAADQQGVAIKNLDFHATNQCFCCFVCNKSLLGGQIAVKENRILCSKECIAVFLQKKV